MTFWVSDKPFIVLNLVALRLVPVNTGSTGFHGETSLMEMFHDIGDNLLTDSHDLKLKCQSADVGDSCASCPPRVETSSLLLFVNRKNSEATDGRTLDLEARAVSLMAW
jgi:hypothetical protein